MSHVLVSGDGAMNAPRVTRAELQAMRQAFLQRDQEPERTRAGCREYGYTKTHSRACPIAGRKGDRK